MGVRGNCVSGVNALRVPGGYATAAILKKGVEWEEAVFDEWLSSMRLVQV
jgi:hypothetical protein